MGPDCGTAIVDGVPLGFANKVRRGPIGCIAASGTGLQQVTALVDRLGAGVSQAIGTGGRDLKAAVGGATMRAALALLAADRDTKVIVLISKPPAPAVAKTVLAAAAKAKKPVVVCFIGADPSAASGRNLHPVRTLEDAARAAVALAGGRTPSARTPRSNASATPRLAPGQRFVRGLFSGGTFCYEASLLLGEALGQVWSNAPVRDEDELDDPWRSRGHSVIDLGDDVFTRGRPHPMIDHRLRNERLVREAGDPEVAVLLVDVVLGLGSHPDPAAEMIPAIEAARAAAAKGKRRIAFVGVGLRHRRGSAGSRAAGSGAAKGGGRAGGEQCGGGADRRCDRAAAGDADEEGGARCGRGGAAENPRRTHSLASARDRGA